MQLDGSKGFKVNIALALHYTALIRYESKFPFYLPAAYTSLVLMHALILARVQYLWEEGRSRILTNMGK